MINWWLEMGVAGFRVDAITHIKKDLDWLSIPADDVDGLASVVKKGRNRPGVGEFLTELKQETFDKYDAVTVGEAYGLSDKELPNFVGPDGYFSMVFDFSYMNIDVKNGDEWYRGRADWTAIDLRNAFFDAQETTANAQGSLANVLENHDQPRVLSKLVPDKNYQTPQAAKALGTMYYFLPGVPFIYQGQEIGMKNFERQSIADFNDVSSINNYNTALQDGYTAADALEAVNHKSRDNARTPMQWDDSVYGGFSDVQPWLEMGNDRDGINVASEQQHNQSVLKYYQALGALHHHSDWEPVIINGDFQPMRSLPDTVVGYQRRLGQQVLTVLVNLGTKAARVNLVQTGQTLQQAGDVQVRDKRVKMSPYSAIVLGVMPEEG
jgi:alpha-glucosidase